MPRRRSCDHATLGGVNRHVLIVIALCAGLLAGCGADNSRLALTQVERRVAKLVGDNESGHAEAKCTEVTEDRLFRCDVSVNALKSTYDAHISENGGRIELDKR